MHSVAYAPSVEADPVGRSQVTDVAAVDGVLGGNRAMFEVIVRRYNPRLYRVGMAYLREHAQTEDAMQNAYLKAFLHLGRFRGNSAFATWLTRIMINECLMILRAKRRYIMESLDQSHQDADQEAFLVRPRDGLLNEEMKAVLERAIQALPRTHRAVYVLREVQHLSTSEAAACLGMSRANVKVSLHRAREGLKAELMKSAAGIELFSYSAQYCDPMTAKVMRAIIDAPATPAA